MTLFLTCLLIGLGFTLFVSSFRWKLSQELMRKTDSLNYQVYRDKKVSASAKLAAGETLGIPVKCTVLIDGREMLIIPSRFHPLLFMTDFPFTFAKAANKKLKPKLNEIQEITFTGRKRKSSVFGSTFDVRISLNNADESKDLLKRIKAWK